MNYNNPRADVRENVAFASYKFSPSSRLPWTMSYRAIPAVAMICDALLIVSASILAGAVYDYDSIVGRPSYLMQCLGLAAVVAALFITLAKSRNLYDPTELLNFKSQIRKLSVKWVGVLLFLAAAGFAMKASGDFSRGTTFLFAVFGLTAILTGRLAWRLVLADGLAVRKFSGRRIALIVEESSPTQASILKVLARHGLQPVYQFILPANQNDFRARKRVIAKAISAVRGSNIEEIIIGADLDHWSGLRELVAELRILPLPVNLVPVGAASDLLQLQSHKIGDTITVELQRGPRTLLERGVKRTIDLVVAGLALLLLLPLFVMTAIAIKLDSPGPVIFRQRRSGFNGRQFQIMKFRTMSVLEDGETVVQAQPNDARITRVGSWLRRTSIDELPQLFNVLQGNMSLVGPRPHALAHDDEFTSVVAKYAYRHHVKPGITGWAQINGFRGQTTTVGDIEKRIELDLWYIDNWSLTLDFRIAVMTAIRVVQGENAY
jgi:putative colanic acid biosynthesis UDP-glucose lipid carrier transferase